MIVFVCKDPALPTFAPHRLREAVRARLDTNPRDHQSLQCARFLG